MIKNSKADFLETIKEGVSEIICPACGSPMTLKNKSTFDVILSVNSRKVMNDILRSYRSFLIRNESELKSRNLHGVSSKLIKDLYPFPKSENVDENGIFNTNGSAIVKNYLSVSDILGISESISKVLTIEDLDIIASSEDKKQLEKIEKAISVIVFGFEPHPLIGSVLNLLFDQEIIKNWIDQVRLGSANSKSESIQNDLINLVTEVAPYYSNYLLKFLDYFEKQNWKDANYKLWGKYSKDEASIIKNQIIRSYYILAILLGHTKNGIGKATQQNIIPFVETNIPFDFPRIVIISQPILNQLLRAKSIIENKGFNLTQKLTDLLNDTKESDNRALNKDKKDISLDDLDKEIQSIVEKYSFLRDEDLNSFVEFTCRGLPSSIPDFNDTTENQKDKPLGNTEHKEKEQIDSYLKTCGWYPKDEPTHPIILIGSTGTTKSSVMMSGLTTFMNAAGSLGISPRSATADDVNLINWYSKEFFEGEMPKATETNSRFSVQLTLAKAQDVKKRVNFIFTDVPGEMVARSLQAKDTDPVVINLLKYAETIVFFFDIATEPYFYSVISKGSDSVKNDNSEIIGHVESLNKDNGRGKTNQILLLNKLIEDLRKIRGGGEKGDIDVKENVRLICIIPKSDLFMGESGDTRFLNEFYDKLKDMKIFDQSQLSDNSNANDFYKWRSMGGVSFEPKPNNNTDLIKRQIEIIQLIDREARVGLSKIGDVLKSANQVSDSDKEILTKRIEIELLKVIENTFNEVYVIPVSAQGEPKLPEDGKKNVQLKYPPCQKLSEYVFITPIVLELGDDNMTGV